MLRTSPWAARLLAQDCRRPCQGCPNGTSARYRFCSTTSVATAPQAGCMPATCTQGGCTQARLHRGGVRHSRRCAQADCDQDGNRPQRATAILTPTIKCAKSWQKSHGPILRYRQVHPPIVPEKASRHNTTAMRPRIIAPAKRPGTVTITIPSGAEGPSRWSFRRPPNSKPITVGECRPRGSRRSTPNSAGHFPG